MFTVKLRLFLIYHQAYDFHCVKYVRIRSYAGSHFLAFELNTERYSLSLRIQSECKKMRTIITRNTDTFCAVFSSTARGKEQ